MIMVIVVSAATALAVTVAGVLIPAPRRPHSGILRGRPVTAEDAAAVLAGLPLPELIDLDSRIHAWIDWEESRIRGDR